MTYKENAGYHFLIFAMSPVLGLVYGIKTKSKKIIRWSLFAFTAIYGTLFHRSFNGDGAVHWQKVYDNYEYLSFEVWWDRLIAILSFAPTPYTNDDVYIHVISYLTGSVFNAPGLFFTVVGLVYAYFYSGAVVKLLSYVNWGSKYKSFYFFFFLILMLLSVSPADMQVVRTWTGAWILIYAILYYYETKKRKYLLLALTPPLVHIGFLLMAIPAWIVLFTGFRNPKVYFLIFLFSIVFSNAVDQIGFTESISQTELGASKTRSYYLDDEKADQREEDKELKASQSTFYKQYEIFGVHYKVYSAMVIFIFIFLRDIGFGKFENMLFSYSLAIASMANFFTQIFAVHNRCWGIATVLILALMLVFLSKNDIKKIRFSFLKVKLPLTIFCFLLLPICLYSLSVFLYYTSAFVLLLPQIQWIDPDNLAISMRGFIGLFF